MEEILRSWAYLWSKEELGRIQAKNQWGKLPLQIYIEPSKKAWVGDTHSNIPDTGIEQLIRVTDLYLRPES